MVNHGHCYSIIRYLIIILSVVFAINNTAVADRDTMESIRAELTWAESDGENYQIFFTSLSNNLWTKKIQLTNNNFTNIHPSISSGSDGFIWVVWTALVGLKSQLFYSNFDGNSWSDPVQISTNFSSNTSPSIIVDDENNPWIVWAGFDGKDDDIFFMRWNGNDWGIPLRVNSDDTYPDILPVVGIGEGGTPWVSWLGYDGDTYRNYFSKWTGTGWKDEIIAEEGGISQLALMKEAYNIPDLPDFLHDVDMASIHIRDGLPIQSIRLRDLANMSNGNSFLYEYKKQTGIHSNAATNQVIVGFGDSITQGVPYIWDFGDGRRVGGYEPKLEVLLNENSQPSIVLNYGNMGEASYMGVSRIGAVLSESNADCILILEGTNDIIFGLSPESTIDNLGIMINWSFVYNAIPVLSTLIPDTKEGGPEKNIPTVYNPKIVALSSEKGVTLCDQYNALADNWSLLTDDGRHPNDSGYQVMAQTWFNSLSQAPAVNTLEPNAVRETIAVLNGLVNPHGHPTMYYFEYGPTSNYGSTTAIMAAGSGTSEIAVSAELTDLTGETTYHYRLVATNVYGKSYGRDITFTTSDGIATTLEASSIGSTTATLNGLVNPKGHEASYYFEYGITKEYGKVTESMDAGSETSEIDVSINLTGLTSQTTYHFRLVVTHNSDISYGNDLTFTTKERKSSSSGGGCFIATAAFGSSIEKHVMILKEFRDKYLITSEWGRKFVAYYYEISPSIADIISHNDFLKIISRICLYPFIGFCFVMLNTSFEIQFCICALFILFLLSFGVFLKRIRYKNPS
jgi:lysophospholipase L1-like esterase